MDKIQKTLINAGRKDLAIKYFKKIIALTTTPQEDNVKDTFLDKNWFKSKPYKLDNLKVVPFQEIKKDAALVKNLNKLKVLTPEQIWEDEFDNTLAYDFDNKVPVVFILKIKNRYFLIYTEGYSYIRYACELKNYK